MRYVPESGVLCNRKLNVMLEAKRDMLEAKRELYSLLLKLSEDEITDIELELMFLLSKDEQIQSLFYGGENK